MIPTDDIADLEKDKVWPVGWHIVKKSSFLEVLLQELMDTKHERPESIRLKESGA